MCLPDVVDVGSHLHQESLSAPSRRPTRGRSFTNFKIRLIFFDLLTMGLSHQQIDIDPCLVPDL